MDNAQAIIDGHRAKIQEMKDRLTAANAKLTEAEASAAHRQALALIDGKEYDSTADLTSLATLRGEVAALQRAVELTTAAHANAVEQDRNSRRHAAMGAWNELMNEREADISTAMAAIVAGLERLGEWGVPPREFNRWLGMNIMSSFPNATGSGVAHGVSRMVEIEHRVGNASNGGSQHLCTTALQMCVQTPDAEAVKQAANAIFVVGTDAEPVVVVS